jgi:hypothetical protein
LAVLDFAHPGFRSEETAPFALRQALREQCQVPFPLFDIAYAIYWKEIRPQTPLRTGDSGFLAASGIPDPAIRQAIVENSLGVPYYLNLSVDAWSSVRERELGAEHPDAAEAQRRLKELQERAMASDCPGIATQDSSFPAAIQVLHLTVEPARPLSENRRLSGFSLLC